MTQEQDKTILQNLIDAGCSENFIDKFFKIKELGSIKLLIPMLNRHKIKLLNDLHNLQKQIDCLDYLIFNFDKIIIFKQ